MSISDAEHFEIHAESEGVVLAFYNEHGVVEDWVIDPVDAVGIARQLMTNALVVEGLRQANV